MLKSCPISQTKIDENAARINSLVVALFCAVIYVFEIQFLSVALLFDFAAKSVNPSFSPLSRGSSWVLRLTGMKRVEIDYAPKRFAAFVGAVLFGFVLLFWYFNLSLLFAATLFVIAACALLEGAFSYCAGCRIYEALISLKR